MFEKSDPLIYYEAFLVTGILPRCDPSSCIMRAGYLTGNRLGDFARAAVHGRAKHSGGRRCFRMLGAKYCCPIGAPRMG